MLLSGEIEMPRAELTARTCLNRMLEDMNQAGPQTCNLPHRKNSERGKTSKGFISSCLGPNKDLLLQGWKGKLDQGSDI